MNTIKNVPAAIRLAEELRFVEEAPSKRERVMAVLQWIWSIIKHPRFASILILLWGFFGVMIFAFADLPVGNEKIHGFWQGFRLLMVVIIPSFLALRVFFLIEDSM